MLPIHRNEQGGGSREATGRPENKKPSGKMRAVKDAGEQHYDPTREHKFKERNETRLARWEEHLKDPIGALDKALKCVENQYYNSRAKILLASSEVSGKSRSGRAFAPTWIRWLRTALWNGTCQGSTGRMASSFSS